MLLKNVSSIKLSRFHYFPDVKNMFFRAFLGNQTIDFSDFWYVTSLIYYFKYGIGSFARKNFFGRKMDFSMFLKVIPS